jgi:hypothetical protein
MIIQKDTVNIDNEDLIIGLSHRSKDFLNIKKMRTLKGPNNEYELKNEKNETLHNILIFILGV